MSFLWMKSFVWISMCVYVRVCVCRAEGVTIEDGGKPSFTRLVTISPKFLLLDSLLSLAPIGLAK